jgi:hypothetical protein
MKLFNELSEYLSDMNVEWHLCGVFAIDAYLGKITRKHKDLDITASFDNIWCYKKGADFIKTEEN